MRAPVFVLLALTAACGSRPEESEIVDCTAEYVYGINVTAVDAETGERIERIWGEVSVGSAREPLEVRDGTGYAAGESPGTYAVEVRAPGYQRWDTSGVTVTGDECHVSREVLIARLERSAS